MDPAAFVAPPLRTPLKMFDPGLRLRGPRMGPDWLTQASSAPPLLLAPHGAPVTDWRLTQPDQHAVRGYAGDVSVAAGGSIDLHLAGADRSVRLDVFRMGLRDARHVLTVRNVPLFERADSIADSRTGRIEDSWPISQTLTIPAGWRPGVYLVKLTGDSGGQSYVIFVVRSPQPTALMVVLPILTYQAYNEQGGASLYGWDAGGHARAYEVSFNRPFIRQFGAGMFFWLDFPLIAWLEDHGYDPGYLTDLDIARNPQLVEGVDTLLFAGHSEYWTGGMRDIVESQARARTNLVFFGANQAYWQIRLAPDRQGNLDRTVICYKDASLDPIAPKNPSSVTVRFDDPLVGLPTTQLMGTTYAGVVTGARALLIGPGMSTFAPHLGLVAGERLPGLVAGEVDVAGAGFNGIVLGSATAFTADGATSVSSSATLWINPAGGRVFDAGTFGFAWGLDPRYAAGLPGFPARAFDELTAEILAWAGAQPSPRLVSVLGARNRYEVVAGNFATATMAIGESERLASQGMPGFLVEDEGLGVPGRFQVEQPFPTEAAATAAVKRLQTAHVGAALETDRGTSP